MKLEKNHLTIGFIELSDCAPLVVALKKGFFAEQGLSVELSREPSWANIRDKVIHGVLDAAQMLAPMPLATTLGLGGVKEPLLTAFVLSLNGNAITISWSLYLRLQAIDAESLQSPPVSAQLVKTALEQHSETLTFASVFPFSMHYYQLREWLAQADIAPEAQIQFIVVPPQQMVSHLQAGSLEGFSVGAPWNSVAVAKALGCTLVTGYDIKPDSAEKVLGVSQAWAEQHPHTHRALLRALSAAARWLDEPANRSEAVQWIANPAYVDVPADIVSLSLHDKILYRPNHVVDVNNFHVFYRNHANCPHGEHAQWILQQMVRWGQLDSEVDQEKVVKAVYREDIYQDALGS